MNWLIKLPLLLAMACAGWWTLAYLVQDWIMFPAGMTPPPLAQPPYVNAEVLKADVRSGAQAEAWFVPTPSALPHNPAPVVVFFHGNAELIDYQSRIVDLYHAIGVSVLLVEYRGYGRSQGKPSQAGFRQDALTFLDQVKNRPDVQSDKIIYHGRSLGGAVATDLAAARPPAALILESTFRSTAAMARPMGVPWFVIKNPFETDRVVATLDRPVLIMHGSQDQIVPVSHGRTLRDLATGSVTYREFLCDHNDFPGLGHETAYMDTIESFLIEHYLISAPH